LIQYASEDILAKFLAKNESEDRKWEKKPLKVELPAKLALRRAKLPPFYQIPASPPGNKPFPFTK
jgi:hypothetical protein